MLLIALAAVLWGTLGVSTRALYALTDLNAVTISFIRLAVATPILLLLAWQAVGARAWPLKGSDLRLTLATGLTQGLSQVAFAAAVGATGVSIATLVTLCVAPVVVALASTVLFGERLSSRLLLALTSALSGTALLVMAQSGQGGQSASLLGVLFALGGAVSYALATLGQRSLVRRYHPLPIVSIYSAAGAVALLPLALASGASFAYPPLSWALLGYLGLVPTVGAYVLFLYGMRSTSATVATIVTLLEAIVAAILAWLLFGETLSPLGLLGALLLLGAILLLARGGAPEPTS